VLVLVLIVVSSVTAVAVGLAYRCRIEMRLAWSNAQRTRDYYLALGGVERIKALMGQEECSPAVIARICQFNGTAKDEGLFEQLKDYDVTESKYLAYCLRDELGHLNVNKSDPASWENLDILSRQCRAGILDWTDADDETGPDGAETDYYQRLEPSYVSKNMPCIALRELLFSRGMTYAAYVGEDINRNLVLESNERDGLLSPPPDNGDSVLQMGLVDIFTVYGDGRININTAPAVVLAALPGLDSEAADIILSHRAGPDRRPGTGDDVGLTSAEEIAEVEGLTELQTELLRQYCCFDSGYFRIFSCAGRGDSFECCLMATVSLTEDELRVVCLERLL
jgi:hypothetical protein